MSQTEVQLIKSNSVVDGDIVGMSSSKLSGTLPAVSGANLTNLPAANLTGTLPAISGANLTGIAAGITMADQWRVTSGFDSYNTIITTNWERQDTYSPGLIGSGMSESSGIFTFPSTGIYRIDFQSHAMRGSAAQIRYVGITIDVTTNNSNYNLVSNSYSSISSDDQAFAAMYCTTLFDVTDVSTHKVRFVVYAENTVSWEGDTSSNRTSVIFTRLGDT